MVKWRMKQVFHLQSSRRQLIFRFILQVFEENGFSDLSDPECDDDESTEKAASRRASRKESNPRNRVGNQNKVANNNNNEAGNSQNDEDKDEDTSKDEPTNIASAAMATTLSNDDGLNVISNVSSPNTSSYETVGNDFGDFNLQTPVQEPMIDFVAMDDSTHPVIITNASIDIYNLSSSPEPTNQLESGGAGANGTDAAAIVVPAAGQTLGPSEPKSNCVSPASSNGGIYSVSTRLSRELGFLSQLQDDPKHFVIEI